MSVGGIVEKYCNMVTEEIMSQEVLLNLNSIRWRGIKAGLNVSQGTMLHINRVLVDKLGKELGAKMLVEELVAKSDGDVELLKAMIECLTKMLK